MIRFIILMFALSSLGACQTARSRTDSYKPYRVVKETKQQKTRSTQVQKRRSPEKRQSKSKQVAKKRSKQFALYDSRELDRKLLRRGEAVRYSQALDLR